MHEIETGLQHAKLDAYATGTCGQDPPFFSFFFENTPLHVTVHI
jgi:hypothetical protein